MNADSTGELRVALLPEGEKIAARPRGISAFVRCQNEEEYIVASIMSVLRVFDEIVVILNRSTDGTSELVAGLASRYPKIRVTAYDSDCASAGAGYIEAVRADPDASLAKYYNWCLEQTAYSHVCKWDGDMIALPPIENVRSLVESCDVVSLDGYDVLGENTTNLEPRIFRFDPAKARYLDWDLYEVLQHEYTRIGRLDPKCYVHMKLVKKEMLHRPFVNPNDFSARPAPPTAIATPAMERSGIDSRLRGYTARLLRRLARLLAPE